MRRDPLLPAGHRLGPHTILELLGEGGSARVYLATHDDGRTLALKVIRADDAAATRRFLREFESLRLLRVPGVVRVYEAGHQGDRVWFSMDRVFGSPFHQALHDEPYLPDRVERLVELSRRLMRALSVLHASGFAHRDLKPSNVLVDAGGAPHVLDFGVSRWFADEGSSTDIVLGTVPYMAPEQVAALPVGPPADVFAAGLMLHEAIAGVPESPANPLGWVARTCMERRPPLATCYREVPLMFSALVERMTSVEPSDRPTAAQCLQILEQVKAGVRGTEWPAPLWVDPGAWWATVEGVLAGDPRVCILTGSRGSGRSRVAEQVHRIGLLEGCWTFRLRCEADRVGAPWLQLLTELTGAIREDTLAEIAGDDFDIVSTLWPHLPLPRASDTASVGRPRELAHAIAAMVRRLSRIRTVVLIIERLEDVDPLSTGVILALMRDGPGMLLVHEHRWSTPHSRGMVRQLRRMGAVRVDAEPHRNPGEIAAALCPAAPPTVARSSSPMAAVEAGWAALARWRGDRFEPLDPCLLPLATHPGAVPMQVLRLVAGKRAEGLAWTRVEGGAVALAGRSARAMAEHRLGDRLRAARQLADTWTRAMETQADPRDLARLLLVAGDTTGAWHHAVQAAMHADRVGRYGEARAWLLLSESLSTGPVDDVDVEFDLAWVKARVALRTDPLTSRRTLLAAAEALATTELHRLRVRILECGYALREGESRKALAAALHVGNQGQLDAATASRALLVAVQVRLGLGDTLAARRELSRAAELAERSGDALLDLDVSGWEAELAWRARELRRTEALCRSNLQRARILGSVLAEAAALSRLAAVLRLRGDRTSAEANARLARQAFAASGDVFLDTEARLALATLEAERGEMVEARARLDTALRHIRGLHLIHLLPAAMRLALRIASARGDVTDGNLALMELDRDPAADDEAAAAMVRWWRARGDLDRALLVERPLEPGFGRGLWHMERARARLSQADPEAAREEATVAMVIAGLCGFADLMLFARLVVEGLGEVEDERFEAVERRAAASPWVDLALSAMEVRARREPDIERERLTWRTLSARARELGYQSDADDADAWHGAAR